VSLIIKQRDIWNDIAQKLESCLSDISRWMKLNLLKLNQDKTELIIFAPKHRSQEFTGCQLEFDGSLVSDAFCFKDLGIFFDKTLHMEKQGSSLANSCFFQIRNIERIRPYISNDASKTLVSALVTYRFDSGNALLFGVNKGNNKITELRAIVQRESQTS
jgi:hypothetical protein